LGVGLTFTSCTRTVVCVGPKVLGHSRCCFLCSLRRAHGASCIYLCVRFVEHRSPEVRRPISCWFFLYHFVQAALRLRRLFANNERRQWTSQALQRLCFGSLAVRSLAERAAFARRRDLRRAARCTSQKCSARHARAQRSSMLCTFSCSHPCYLSAGMLDASVLKQNCLHSDSQFPSSGPSAFPKQGDVGAAIQFCCGTCRARTKSQALSFRCSTM
jgi:hypothetical protein